MSNALVRAGQGQELPAVQIDTSLSLMEVCQALAKSGYFKDTRDVSQAVVKVLYGQELGIGAVTSMMSIHIIEGKPAPSANLLAALVARSGRYRYRVLEHSDAACELLFQEREGGWQDLGRLRWTRADAERAGLWGRATWKSYPRQMLFSRALSEGVRVYCPELFGGAPVYTPEELGADVDAEGNLARPARSPERPPTQTRVDTATGEVIDVTARATGAMETESSYAQATGLKAPAAPAAPAATGGDDLGALKQSVSAHLKALGFPTPKTPSAFFGEILGTPDCKQSELGIGDWEFLDVSLSQAVTDRKACFAAYADWCKREGHAAGDDTLRHQCWAQLLELPSLESSGTLTPTQWQALRFALESRVPAPAADPFDGE